MTEQEKITRENIVSREWCEKKNIFVEAGAGAGKTSIIVKRVVNQLKWGIFKAEELVVITFTKKAAAQLYDRISNEIAAALKSDSLLPDEKVCLDTALNNIDRMTISTIHSFCLKLLKERAFDAEIPLDAALIESEEEKSVKKAFFEDWFSQNIVPENAKQPAENGTLDIFAETKAYKGNPELWNFKQLVQNAFIDISNRLMDTKTELIYPSPDNYKGKNEYDRIFEELAAKMREALINISKTELKAESIDLSDILLSGSRNKLESSSPYEQLKYFADNYNVLYQVKNNIGMKQDSNKTNGARERIANSFSAWLEKNVVNNDDLKQYDQFGCGIILETAKKAAEAYNRQKTGRQLSDDDLLIRARDLVCTSEEARKYFAKKYKCIYIDEFQDTDHIQQEMLIKLACGEDGKIRDGALFVVGDPKQSIYRFRNAELDIFFETRELIEKQDNGVSCVLSTNFRSNDKIIKWVNEKFGIKFDHFNTGDKNDIIYNDMDPHNRANGSQTPLCGVYRYGIEEKTEVDTDAVNLSRLINNLIKEKRPINIYKDGKITGTRPVEYRDFLILTKTTNNLASYLDALLRYNIPVIVGMKKVCFENTAISRFSILYSYLANGFDRIAQAGAMGVALDTDFPRAEENEWKAAQKRISDLYYYTLDMDAYALAVYLSHRIDLLLPHREINSSEANSAISQVFQMVESVLNTEHGSRQTLAEAFKAYRQSKTDGDMPLEIKPDAVSIMNIHQAKGLEGNIVIIAGREAEKEHKSSHKHNNGKVSEYYYSIKAENSYGPPTYYPSFNYYPKIKEEAEKAELGERLRLEYVAATRAKEVLIFMDKLSEESAWFCDYTEADISDIPDEYKHSDEPHSEAEEYIPTEKKLQFEPSQLAMVYNKVNPSLFDHTAPKKQKTAAFEGEGEDKSQYTAEGPVSAAIDNDEAYEQPEEEKTHIRGDIFGTAMHRSFELIVNRFVNDGDKDKEKLKDYAASAIAQALIEGLEDMGEYMPNYKARLEGMLDEFLKDDALIDKIAKAKAVYTELPFSFFIDENDAKELSSILKNPVASGSWINGTADLVLENSDKSVIVLDYKSNRNKTGKSDLDFISFLENEEYASQLAVYRFAAKKLFETDNVSTAIVNYQTKA